MVDRSRKRAKHLQKQSWLERFFMGHPYTISLIVTSVTIKKLHRASLRTITGLPKHLRNEDLLKLATIPLVWDIFHV